MDDLVDEANETFTLGATLTSNGSNYSDTGTATITDNDTPTILVGQPGTGTGDITVPEGQYAIFGVNVTGAAAGSTLTLAFANGTAINPDDYAAGTFQYSTDSGTTWNNYTTPITLATGNSDVRVRTTTVDDLFDEADETFTLTGTLTSNGSTYSDLGTATILDNDTPTILVGQPGTGTGDITVPEGQYAIFGVNVTGAAAGSTLTLAFANGTAINPDDYAAGTFQYSTDGGTTWNNYTTPVALSAGNSDVRVRTTTVDDLFDEADETFTLTGTLTSNGSTYSDLGTATILDNDTPTILVGQPGTGTGDITVPEGDYAIFGVNVTGAAAGSTLTLAFANGTAINPDDYAAGTFQYSTDGGTTWNNYTTPVALSAGNSDVRVRTTTVDDLVDEANETFTLGATLTSNGSNYSDTGTATITDNDTPTILVGQPGTGTGDITVPEGQYAIFGVNVTGAAAGSTLTLAFANGTAINPDDYAAGTFQYSTDSGTTWNNYTTPITLATGNSDVRVRTTTVDDLFDEADETFTLTGTLTSNGSTYSDLGTATILDNDTPTILVGQPGTGTGDITVPEGDYAIFGVNVTGAAAGSTLTLAFANGTAINPDDYAAGTFQYSTDGGTTWNNYTTPVALSAGNSDVRVRTTTADDLIYEGDETFVLTGTLTSNGTNYSDTGTATIQDNDTPTLAVSDITVLESAGYGQFTVSISKVSTQDTQLSLALSNGTATGGGTDYGSAGADNIQVSTDNGATWTNAVTATIAAGQTSVLVRTPINNENLYEPQETFSLTATRTGGTPVTNPSSLDSGTALLISDDQIPRVLTITPAAQTVSEGTNLVYTVTLTNPSYRTEDFIYSLSGSGANQADPASDFGTPVFSNGAILTGPYTLSVPANVTSFTVTIPVTSDMVTEGTETAALTIDGVTSTATVNDLASPIILDLNGDGVHSTGLDAGVAFDVNNDGTSNNTGWVSAQDGLLVRDISGDGVINDGSELFGSGTSDGQGGRTSDGFEALSLLDDNRDAVIDSNDAAWGELRVWRDLDTDGFTDNGELVSLESLGVQSLNLTYTTSDATENGNLHGLVGTYTATDGQSREMTDVFFATGDAVVSEPDGALNDNIPTLTDVVTSLAPAIGSGAQLDTHLVLVIDTSAGMGQIFNNSLETRLDRAIEATQELIDGLGIAGNVDVRIVTFNSSAQILTGADWVDGDTAKGLLGSLSASADDTRDYEIALEQVMAIGSYPATPAGSQSLLYFFSDGGPTAGSLENNAAAWRTYAAAHFDQIQAFGLGSSPDTLASLNQISANTHAIGDMDQLNDSVLDNITAPQLTGLRVSDAGGEVTISLNRPFTFDGLFDDPALADTQPAFEWYRSGILALDETGASALADVQWSLSPDGDSLTANRNGVNLLSLEMTDPSEGGAFLITQHVPLAGVASISVPYAFSDEDQAASISAINLEIRDTKIASAPPTGDGGEGLYAENGADVLIYDATDSSTSGSEGWNSLFFESTLDLTPLSVPAIGDMAALRLAANTDLQHISLGDLIDIADERIDAFFTNGEGNNDVGINDNSHLWVLPSDPSGLIPYSGIDATTGHTYSLYVEQDISLHGNTA